MATFKCILVPTDFSEPSQRALQLAIEMARGSSAELVVLHICEIPTYAYAGMATPVDLLSPISELAGQKLDELLTSLRAKLPAARGVLKVGVPWEQILATISDVGADLVVMGTHGRRGAAHVLLGSVAEKIVRMSPVPVLTVRGSSTPGAATG
jgi:nucleotide-binding universal stress UspA family protein